MVRENNRLTRDDIKEQLEAIQTYIHKETDSLKFLNILLKKANSLNLDSSRDSIATAKDFIYQMDISKEISKFLEENKNNLIKPKMASDGSSNIYQTSNGKSFKEVIDDSGKVKYLNTKEISYNGTIFIPYKDAAGNIIDGKGDTLTYVDGNLISVFSSLAEKGINSQLDQKWLKVELEIGVKNHEIAQQELQNNLTAPIMNSAIKKETIAQPKNVLDSKPKENLGTNLMKEQIGKHPINNQSKNDKGESVKKNNSYDLGINKAQEKSGADLIRDQKNKLKSNDQGRIVNGEFVKANRDDLGIKKPQEKSGADLIRDQRGKLKSNDQSRIINGEFVKGNSNDKIQEQNLSVANKINKGFDNINENIKAVIKHPEKNEKKFQISKSLREAQKPDVKDKENIMSYEDNLASVRKNLNKTGNLPKENNLALTNNIEKSNRINSSSAQAVEHNKNPVAKLADLNKNEVGKIPHNIIDKYQNNKTEKINDKIEEKVDNFSKKDKLSVKDIVTNLENAAKSAEESYNIKPKDKNGPTKGH